MRTRPLIEICALVLIGIVALWDASASAAYAAPATSAFRVFAQEPPPSSDSDHSLDYYSLTDAATNDAAQLTPAATSAHIGKYYRVWGNFCNPPKANSAVGDESGCVGGNRAKRTKGNYLNYPNIRTPEGKNLFSTYRQANNCTLSQTAFMLGWSQRAIESKWGAGLSIVWDPSKWVMPTGSFTNICVMPRASVPTVSGILIDYEVGDGRTPAQTTAFLTEFTSLIHAAGKKAVLYGHVLGRSRFDGIDSSNAFKLNEIFDYMTIGAWANENYSDTGSMTASLQKQLEILKGGPGGSRNINYSHLMVNYDLGGSTLADAAVVRSMMLANHIPAVIFWKDKKRSEGTPPAQKIACLVHGNCPGGSGAR